MKPGLFKPDAPVGTRFLYKVGGREVHAGTVLGYSPTKRYVQLGPETWEEGGFIQVLEVLFEPPATPAVEDNAVPVKARAVKARPWLPQN